MTLQVGQKATRSITLTDKHVEMYSEITGDHNPLHYDEDFTSKTLFGRLIVQQDGEVMLEGEAVCYTVRPEDD